MCEKYFPRAQKTLIRLFIFDHKPELMLDETTELQTNSVCSVGTFSKCEIFYRGDAFIIDSPFATFPRAMPNP